MCFEIRHLSHFFDAGVLGSNGTDVVVHHVVELERAMGALQITIGTYPRSISGEKGSMVLNQSICDPSFDFHTEFIPLSLNHRPDLQSLLHTPPCIWSWSNGHIHRRCLRND